MSSLPNNIRPIFCINPRDHIVRCLSGVKKNSQSPLIENFFLVLYLMDLLISNHFPALYNFCPGSYGPAAPTPAPGCTIQKYPNTLHILRNVLGMEYLCFSHNYINK